MLKKVKIEIGTDSTRNNTITTVVKAVVAGDFDYNYSIRKMVVIRY